MPCSISVQAFIDDTTWAASDRITVTVKQCAASVDPVLRVDVVKAAAKAWQTTASVRYAKSIPVRDGVSETEVLNLPQARDTTLDVTTPIHLACQAKRRAGQLASTQADSTGDPKSPWNAFGKPNLGSAAA